VCLLLFPWVFFAVNPFGRKAQVGSDPTALVSVSRPWLSLCWIWAGVIIAFFSIPHSKLIGYVLPVMPALALLAALGWQRSMAQRRHAGRIFAGLCALNIGIALLIVTQVGPITRDSRAQDIAPVLACAIGPDDTVYVSGAYPYDLPFYAQARKPMVVIENWPVLRKEAGDNWQRELFEGADFDAQAARVLQLPSELDRAGVRAGNWFVASTNYSKLDELIGWKPYYRGAGWILYQSGAALPVPETGNARCR
jgi:hypothetical protein